MSSMKLEAAVRFTHTRDIPQKDMTLDFITNIMGSPPTDYDTDDEGYLNYFTYTPNNHKDSIKGLWLPNYINGTLYIDYMLTDSKEDDCGFDFDITLEEFKDIQNKYLYKFGFLRADYKFKILYYYNGGCAGLCEVE